MFDFIITFQDWLSSWLDPVRSAFTYDPLNGSYYEFQISVVLQFLTYIVWIGVFVFVVFFILAFVKSVYYFLQQALG